MSPSTSAVTVSLFRRPIFRIRVNISDVAAWQVAFKLSPFISLISSGAFSRLSGKRRFKLLRQHRDPPVGDLGSANVQPSEVRERFEMPQPDVRNGGPLEAERTKFAQASNFAQGRVGNCACR